MKLNLYYKNFTVILLRRLLLKQIFVPEESQYKQCDKNLNQLGSVYLNEIILMIMQFQVVVISARLAKDEDTDSGRNSHHGTQMD